MTKILTANAVARTAGNETFARAVFEGPVFKNKKKIATNIPTHAAGNGMYKLMTKIGHAISIPMPETQKSDPGKRGRNLSATTPPSNVEVSPATAVINPKIVEFVAVPPVL